MRERVRAVIEPQLHFLDLRGEVEEPAPALEAPDTETPAPQAAATRTPPTHTAPAASAGGPDLPDGSPATAPGFWLDRKQERMARELASPRALVYGPAGSGKTVFLVSRAQYWLDRRPGARVLFTCYNASLSSHIRQVFRSRGMEPDGDRLTVRHYHDLCGFILGMSDIHNRPPEFYAALEPKVLRELSAREDVPAYDLILVDEGQDFTRRMVEVLVRLGADGGEITLVCDPAQDIYGRWSPDTLAPFREHDTEHLVDVYRNTAPIFALARSVLTPEMRQEMGLTRLEMTRPEDLGRTGPAPELVTLPGLDALADVIVGQVQLFRREGRPLSDLAVLYPDRGAIARFGDLLARSHWQAARDPRFREPDDEDAAPEPDVVLGTLHPQSDRDDAPPSSHPHFAEALEQELTHRGVPAEWAARDYDSKARFDISKDRLTLSTVHSAKGMDFHTVVLLGVDTLPYREGKAGHRARSLLFTGITRARERLVLAGFGDGGWVREVRGRLEGV
jgi:superfamily I DNA/RNA helicase